MRLKSAGTLVDSPRFLARDACRTAVTGALYQSAFYKRRTTSNSR